jgi:hypothetical protein
MFVTRIRIRFRRDVAFQRLMIAQFMEEKYEIIQIYLRKQNPINPTCRICHLRFVLVKMV